MKRAILSAIGIVALTLALCPMQTKADTSETYIDEQYVEYCEQIGQELGICPELLIAIIESESSGNPSAQNGTCIGLMGVEIEHAQELAREEELGNVWLPYANIYTGALILLEKTEIDSDIGVALSYYKGYSTGSVRKYIDKGKIPPLADKVLLRSAELERLHGK